MGNGKKEGPFTIVLTQNLKGVATDVYAYFAQTRDEAMARARHLVLEKKPPELRCDPSMDTVSVWDLSRVPCKDILTRADCGEWRRQADVYTERDWRMKRKKGDDEDTRKIDLVKQPPLKVVDFRNDGE